MPFKSKAQARYLESSDSPLTEGQKREFEGATKGKLPAHVNAAAKHLKRKGKVMNAAAKYADKY